MSSIHLLSEPDKNAKVLIIGDGMVGKTCMIKSYIDQKFPTDYLPTTFDIIKHKMVINGIVSDVKFRFQGYYIMIKYFNVMNEALLFRNC